MIEEPIPNPEYTETEGSYIETNGRERTIPKDPENTDYRLALEYIAQGWATITTPYDQAAEELARAIDDKVAELKGYFMDLHGVPYDLAVQLDQLYDPLDPSTLASVKYHADIAQAVTAGAAILALTTTPDVVAYDVAVDPSWST
jgi:hypothetical protein